MVLLYLLCESRGGCGVGVKQGVLITNMKLCESYLIESGHLTEEMR